MILNNKGQSTAHHWGWMAVVLVIFLTCAWIYSANRPNQFEKGSEQNSSTVNRYALAELVFSPFNWQGCATVPVKHKPETYAIATVDSKPDPAPVVAPSAVPATAKEDSGW